VTFLEKTSNISLNASVR